MNGPDEAERRAISDRLYARSPDRFGREPSHFVSWALERFPQPPAGARVLELGCGPGRDSFVLARAGARVRAVDHSSVAIERARSRAPGPGNPEFVRGSARDEVEAAPPGGFDVVYAHALYMILPEEELDQLLAGIYRALRPGGAHLFAVRSTTDPHYGQGTEVAPDVYSGGPHEGPMRYYRRETLARFARPGFERGAAELRTDFHLWWVADRRPETAPGVR